MYHRRCQVWTSLKNKDGVCCILYVNQMVSFTSFPLATIHAPLSHNFSLGL